MYTIEILCNDRRWVAWPEGEEPEVFGNIDLAEITAEGIPVDELRGREIRINCNWSQEAAA